MNIVVIGADARSVDLLAFILKGAGYDASCTISSHSPDLTWTEHLTDLVILDMLAIDEALLKHIMAVRGASSAAIMLLAATSDESEMIRAYEAGIDDFLHKPFGYGLFLAHVTAQLRRARVMPAALVLDLQDTHLTLDPERHMVTLSDGTARPLTNLEFRLLYCLVTNRGHVLTTETIIEKVWGYSGEGDRNLLKSLISRLRAKVEPTPHDPHLISTVPGVGYTFNPGTKD